MRASSSERPLGPKRKPRSAQGNKRLFDASPAQGGRAGALPASEIDHAVAACPFDAVLYRADSSITLGPTACALVFSSEKQTLAMASLYWAEHGEIEAGGGHLRQVRILFELRKIRHHKYTHCIWSAYRAEPVHGSWDSDARPTCPRSKGCD